MSKDSTHTYVHFHAGRHADLFDDLTSSASRLPHEPIFVPPEHQPPNPEDEDDVVPDQHAAFGIQSATQKKEVVAWRDLGLQGLVSGVGRGAGGGMPR